LESCEGQYERAPFELSPHTGPNVDWISDSPSGRGLITSLEWSCTQMSMGDAEATPAAWAIAKPQTAATTSAPARTGRPRVRRIRMTPPHAGWGGGRTVQLIEPDPAGR